MPPRKKSSRAVASLPARSGKETNEQQRHKMMLQDYSAQVSSALKDMEKEKRIAVIELRRHFDALIAAIPPEFKRFTLAEFAALGGTYDKAMASVSKERRLEEVKALKCTTADLKFVSAPSKAAKDLNKENKDIVTDLGTVTTQIRAKRRKGRALRTPAITPKFDPNQGSTPENTRDIMPGETLMSLAGSPVRAVSRIGGHVAKATQVEKRLEETLMAHGVTPTKIGGILESMAAKLVD